MSILMLGVDQIEAILSYLTRSARVKGRLGFDAKRLTSLSEIEALEGGCDHWLVDGGSDAVLVLRY